MANRVLLVAKQRLTKEYRALTADPVAGVTMKPDPKDIFTWYFVIDGHVDWIIGGEYFGRITFPQDYPMSPCDVYMTTPNGFLTPDMKVCMSMTSWHPESHNPSWGPKTIILGFLTFIEDVLRGRECSATMIHGFTEAIVKKAAKESRTWNLQYAKFNEIFPDFAKKSEQSTDASDTTQKTIEQPADNLKSEKIDLESKSEPGTVETPATLESEAQNKTTEPNTE